MAEVSRGFNRTTTRDQVEAVGLGRLAGEGDRFLREGDVWVQLGRHPHVVRARRVRRVGDGREVYLVLDWVAPAEGKRGASLREWLWPGQALTLEQTLDFALQIVRGLRHAWPGREAPARGRGR